MSDFDTINSVFGILSADSVFLGYFGLTSSSTMAQRAAKIQKEIDPEGLTKDNIPLCCIYPIPGARSRINDCIYDGMFEVVIYSNSSSGIVVSKTGTMIIGKRARELLNYKQLAGNTLLTEFQTSFQTNSNVSGIKKYVMRFKVSEVIE